MTVFAEPYRRYRFTATDENGDDHDITPEGPLFIGTFNQARQRAQVLADEYETKTGHLILRVTCESFGKVSGLLRTQQDLTLL
jgi:hypothetical protein